MINQRRPRSSALLLLLFASFVAGTLAATYRVTDYGAKGDGITDDTQAFTNAWRAVCLNSKEASTLLIPGGKVYLLGLTKFGGPCKHYIRVQVDGNLKRVDEVWSDDDNNWLLFINLNGRTVAGPGEIDGQGASWWACEEAKACAFLAANSLALLHVTKAQVLGLSFKNSAMMHVAIGMSVGVRISNLKITAPAESPNTDGIHVERSRHVIISDCQISTGDDCVSVSSGAKDVNISRIRCGPGHGLSIGSLGIEKSYATAEGIHVSDSTIVRTDNGVRIKTWQGATGFARDISFRNISLTEVRNPIIIDQFYCPRGGCKNEVTASACLLLYFSWVFACSLINSFVLVPCWIRYMCASSKTSAVQVSDVKFIGVKGTSANDMAIRLECSQSSGCHDVVMEDVDIRNAVPGEQAQAFCFNAHGKKAKVVKPDVPCLSY
ncbi:polygalacturonase ADPG1-like [Zingiber officinale]|uniref:polygalacturonase ADPG1-like n=1 Tax=Zingiber officinale TaxID=94328 RepID=UPI001C4C9892|nr:polygalacturonase ADPG1-like [Zingiber officinale]